MTGTATTNKARSTKRAAKNDAIVAGSSVMTRRWRGQQLIAFVGCVAVLVSCGGTGPTAATSVPTTPAAVGSLDSAQAVDVMKAYADIAWKSYSAALAGAQRMQQAVQVLVDQPDQANLDAARKAWLAARPDYLHTEGFRFSGGPIDSGDVNVEGFINAWPVDEVFIDVILADSDPLTPSTLRQNNERGGERNISTGWHALEYLLWGVDSVPMGPGDRPVSDFVGTELARTRLRTYLATTADMLVDDLDAVAAQWDPASGVYRSTFVQQAPSVAIKAAFTGIGTLSGGELFGQRMAVPYETKDQEEEHSCFSDNTTADHIGDVQSIRRIYLGLGPDETPVGPSLSTLVAAVNPSADAVVRDALERALRAVEAIPNPFDQAIQGSDSAPGRVAIRAALDAVSSLTTSLTLAGQALGVEFGIDVP
jgi:putative iron-regulated protein